MLHFLQGRQMIIARSVQLLNPEMLEDLPTKQLLGRLRRLRECEESRKSSYHTDEEIAAAPGIVFKDDPRWEVAVNELKRVLATREHVPRPAENARERQLRASKQRERYRNRSR